MASQDSHDLVPVEQSATRNPGTAVERSDALENPGLPPHRPRVTDLDPKAATTAERLIVALFYVSLAGTIFSMAAYFAFPIRPNDLGSVRINNLMVGLGLAFALLAIGVAAVHWGKALMVDHEGVDIRHPVRGDAQTRERAVEIMRVADRESGFNRRVLIRNGMIASIAALPLPAIFLFRDLGPASGTPAAAFSHTMWAAGTRLTKDPTGDPILASDVTIGSAFHVIPEGLNESEHKLEEKGKAAVLLMRLEPGDLHVSAGKEDWNYGGIVAYSKICTPRRLPGGAVRAGDPSPAVPLPPVAVRHHAGGGGHLRTGRPPAAPAADHGRQRGLPGRAQRLPRTSRTELLGAHR